MDRLRDLVSRTRRPFSFSLPTSFPDHNLPERSYSNNDLSVPETDDRVEQGTSARPHSIAHLSLQSTVATQTDTDNKATPPIPETMKSGGKSQEVISGTFDDQENVALDKKHLFELAEVLTTQNDALLDSGRSLSKRLNETAREVLAANQIVKEKSAQIAKINEQIRVMELKFDEAHAQLQDAQKLAGQVLDGAAFEIYMRNQHGVMGKELKRMKESLQGQDVSEWPKEKIDEFLTRLNGMYAVNNLEFCNSEAVYEDLASIFNNFRDLDFDPKYSHLFAIAQPAPDALEAYQQEDHDMAKQYEVKKNQENKAVEVEKQVTTPSNNPVPTDPTTTTTQEKEKEDDEESRNVKTKLDDNKTNCKNKATHTLAAQGSSTEHKGKGNDKTKAKGKGKGKGKAKAKSEEQLPMDDCDCFACHIANNPYNVPDLVHDPLMRSFMQSMYGIEAGFDGFIDAGRDVSPEFKQAVIESIQAISSGNETLNSKEVSQILLDATSEMRRKGAFLPLVSSSSQRVSTSPGKGLKPDSKAEASKAGKK